MGARMMSIGLADEIAAEHSAADLLTAESDLPSKSEALQIGAGAAAAMQTSKLAIEAACKQAGMGKQQVDAVLDELRTSGAIRQAPREPWPRWRRAL